MERKRAYEWHHKVGGSCSARHKIAVHFQRFLKRFQVDNRWKVHVHLQATILGKGFGNFIHIDQPNVAEGFHVVNMFTDKLSHHVYLAVGEKIGIN